MVANLSLALSLMPQPQAGSFDFSVFAQASSGQSASIYSAGNVHVALQQAEQNEEKQLEQARKSPVVQKELERYARVVSEAETVEEILDDPVARKVLMKANGLGEHVDSVGLAKKAMLSDPSSDSSLANRLSSVNGNWLEFAKTYNLELFGVGRLQTSDAINEVMDNYVAEIRLDQLDEQLPGLGSALLFKRIAANLDEPLKILGSALGREVVTTAFALPKELALQSLQAQEKAITQRLDIEDLQDPKYVERLTQRYLIQLNGGQNGITA